MRMGIRFKIICFISTLLALVVSVLSYFVLNQIAEYQKRELEEVLINQKNIVERYISEQYKSRIHFDSDDSLLRTSATLLYGRFYTSNMPIELYNLNGAPYINMFKERNDELNEYINQHWDHLKSDKIVYLNRDDMIYFFTPLKYENKTVAYLEIDYDNGKRASFYKMIKNMFIYVGFISLTCAIILGIIYFLNLTKSILDLNKYVKFIENGEFDKVQIIERNDEIGELSSGIAYMSSSIKKNITSLENERHNLKLAVTKLNTITDEQKSFIGSVTHEFKNPITIIQAYSDLLKTFGEDINLVNEAGYNISTQSHRLKNMVDKILMLSSLEKYDFQLDFKKVNIKQLIENICDSMNVRAEKNDIEIICNLKDMHVLADEESMKHVFINLIDNGIKYNKKSGSITILSEESNSYYIIKIIDTGIGMPGDTLEKIFEPFYRVDKEGLSSPKGTGLGLSLVKNLLEKHKSEIWTESKLNCGSTFFIKMYK